MDWQSDKITHYKFCYKATMAVPRWMRKWWGYKVVLPFMNIVKEDIYDGLLKRGCYEEADKEANRLGVEDAIAGRKPRYE